MPRWPRRETSRWARGAGHTVDLKGGLGRPAHAGQGFTVGAGRGECRRLGTIGDGPHFWAAPTSRAPSSAAWRSRRRRGARLPLQGPAGAGDRHDSSPRSRPTRRSTKAECKRLAIMANDGLARAAAGARAQRRRHGVRGGDGRPHRAANPPVLTELGTVAADCLARAVARGVYEATALPYTTACPTGDALRRERAMMGVSGGVRRRGHRRIDPARHEHLGGAVHGHALPVAHARHQHPGLAGDGPGRRLVRRARRRRRPHAAVPRHRHPGRLHHLLGLLARRRAVVGTP